MTPSPSWQQFNENVYVVRHTLSKQSRFLPELRQCRIRMASIHVFPLGPQVLLPVWQAAFTLEDPAALSQGRLLLLVPLQDIWSCPKCPPGHLVHAKRSSVFGPVWNILPEKISLEFQISRIFLAWTQCLRGHFGWDQCLLIASLHGCCRVWITHRRWFPGLMSIHPP